MIRKRFAVAGLTLAAAALLSACSGEDNGDTSVPTGNFDVQTGLRNLLTGARSFMLTGKGSDNVPYTLVFNLAPGAAAAFPPTGISGDVMDSAVTVTAGNGQTSAAATTYYFDPATLAIIGMQFSNSTSPAVTCATTSGNAVLPTSVPVGTSGALVVAGQLGSCLPGATAIRLDNITWSLESGGGFALLCINSGSSTAATGSESDCVEIMADGALGTRARVTLTAPIPGGTYSLVTKNY